MRPLIALIGAGGHGREVMQSAQRMTDLLSKDGELLFAIEGLREEQRVSGRRLVSIETFIKHSGDRFFNIAINDSHVRERIAKKLIHAGCMPFCVVDPSALKFGTVGQGSILCPFSIVNVDAMCGDFFHAGVHASVSHDCRIGDFVTFAPRVTCNGAVTIEDHVYVGASAVIRNSTPDRRIVIGRGAVIGMGAVVTRSVKPFTTVVGNPAREM